MRRGPDQAEDVHRFRGPDPASARFRRRVCWLIGQLAHILASRITLGFCAVILVGNAILGRVYQVEQIDTLTAEQECREEIAGILTVQMAVGLKRVLEGLLEVSEGDEAGLAAVVALASDELLTLGTAIDNQEHAIEICEGGGQ